MDKTGFLKELKRYLVVLNEGEQKDILDEYAQHIDMKMERGMSESEAIRDFGDIEELASEILEAYHVNPQYGAGKHVRFPRKEEIPVADIAETGKKFWSGLTGFFQKMWNGAAAGFAGLCNLAKKPFRYASEVWEDRRGRRGLRAVPVPEDRAAEPKKIRRMNMIGEIPGMAAGGIRKLFYACAALAAWCIRWAWNLMMMFAALIAGFMMLFGLFGLGTLAVLLIQGYPLAGFTLGCLGGVLCLGSLTVIAICLCRFKRQHTEQKEAETVYEELQQEEMAGEEVPEHV